MEYSNFINEVYTGVKERIASESVRVELGDAKIINRSGATIVVVRDGVGAVFYVEDWEQHYSVDESIERIMDGCFPSGGVAETIDKVKKSVADVEFVKKHVVPALVGTEKNQEKLEGTVSRKFFDLSLIYKIPVDRDEDNGVYSVTITDSLLIRLGLSEKELWEYAWQNVEAKSTPMGETLRGFGVALDASKCMPMQVLTTEESINGAITMLMDDLLQDTASEFGNNLIIIPSSIHEVLAIPYGDLITEVGEVASMIREVNDSVVAPEDILSYSVYWYDREEHTLNCEGYEPLDLRTL